jgi:hypothetical protein
VGVVVTVAQDGMLRGADPRAFAAWRRRIEGLASRARDPAERARRLERLALRAEHDGAWLDCLDLAHRPLDLTAAPSWVAEKARTVVRHRPARPGPKSGPRVPESPQPTRSLAASAAIRHRRIRETRPAVLSYDRSKPRGYHATLRADGLFDVSDPHGQPVRGLALTAAANLVEYAAKPPLDLPPGELTARNVLRFGDLVVGFARELLARP